MKTKLLFALLICATLAEASDQKQDGAAPDAAQQTLQRAIRAAGGVRALNRLKGPMMWMDRGTFHGMGQGIPFVAQYATKWPNWYRQEVEGAFTITVSGKRAWVTGANGLQRLSGDTLDEQLRQVRATWAERLFPLTDKSYKLSRVDGIQVNGRETVGIKAKREKDRDIKLFFDKQTYLLAKIETEVISPQHGPKPVSSETLFSAHKSFGGGKVPTKAKIYYDKKLFVELETVDYKLGATLDPEHFQEPK